MHLFINGLAASAGGGLTYLRNVLPILQRRDEVKTSVLLSEPFHDEFRETHNLSILRFQNSSGAAVRFWYEQAAVRGLVQRSGAQILLSTGNFAIWNSPVPQILLSRNALYTSRDFESDLRSRGEPRLWLETQFRGAMAKWSIAAADCTVAPSQAFAAELRAWTGEKIVAIHHGFDREHFLSDSSPLPATLQQKISFHAGALRLLLVSHYNYYRNFETLFRLIALLRQKLAPRPVVLFLTCKLASGNNPGSYRTDVAVALAKRLGLGDNLIELDAVPYQSLHNVYRAADVYVSTAYAESFAHPLVEAMASGLPVVASDLAVHKEVCGHAARYAPAFSAEEFGTRVMEIAASPELAAQLAAAGVERSLTFSWNAHVDKILALARNLAADGATSKRE